MRYRIKTGRLFSLAALILAGMLCSCSEQDQPDTEALVRFSLAVPGNAGTRGLSAANEKEVRQIDVLVFKPSGGDYMYTARTEQITDEGNGTKSFEVLLREGDYDIAILANARASITSVSLTGKTKAQALALLTVPAPTGGKWITNTAAGNYQPIPMWGDVGTQTIAQGIDFTGANGVTLTRMIARVDVKLADAVQNFELTSVHVYNYNNQGSIVPADTNWNSVGNVATAPTVPATATLTRGPLAYTGLADVRDYSGEIYLFEAVAGSIATRLTNTCLVVGGKYNGAADPTYYRVDFNTGVTSGSGTYLALLRNHQYTVTINAVTGPGEPTSLAAFNLEIKIPILASTIAWNWGTDVDMNVH
jgi:hypothetical protein